MFKKFEFKYLNIIFILDFKHLLLYFPAINDQSTLRGVHNSPRGPGIPQAVCAPCPRWPEPAAWRARGRTSRGTRSW